MKVGDLVSWKKPVGYTGPEDIGVVTHVYVTKFIDVLFADGEHCVAADDYEVANEPESR